LQEWEYVWFQIRWVPLRTKKRRGTTVVEGRWEGAEKVAELGQQGWELVSVQPFISTFGGESWAGGPGSSEVSSYMFFFKRPKRSSEEDTRS
jgi:hypothetical protein